MFCFQYHQEYSLYYFRYYRTKLSNILDITKTCFLEFLNQAPKNRCVIITHIYPAGIFLLKVNIKKNKLRNLFKFTITDFAHCFGFACIDFEQDIFDWLTFDWISYRNQLIDLQSKFRFESVGPFELVSIR